MNSKHIYIKTLDAKIIRFIKKHHVLTLATSHANSPYCCSCFYAYREKENEFIITSDDDTRHVKEMLAQPDIAGGIALETTMVGKIQGLQFTGTIERLKDKELEGARHLYISRFPVSAFADLMLWKINPNFMKFTDNRLGFGKKMIWEKHK
jgi:uncharacterized protein